MLLRAVLVQSPFHPLFAMPFPLRDFPQLYGGVPGYSVPDIAGTAHP